MMALAVCLAIGSGGSSAPSIEIKDGRILIEDSGRKVDVQIPREPLQQYTWLHREGGKFVAWDKRGLTVRSGKWAKSFTLQEAAVTPKLFSKEQILETADLARSGVRQLAASRLSGYEQVGSQLILLIRWEDRDSKPWLEALYSLDLTKKQPSPALVGRFIGFSLGSGTDGAIADELRTFGGEAGAVTVRGAEWGISTWNPKEKRELWTPCGIGLYWYAPHGGNKLLFKERTPYGTAIAGECDALTGARQAFIEHRGRVDFVPGGSGVLRLGSRQGAVLRSIASGAEIRLPTGSGAVQTDLGTVMFAPAQAPTSATLYRTSDWLKLADWKAK